MADSTGCEDNKDNIQKVVPKTEDELPNINNVIESELIKKETQSVADPTEFELKPNYGRVKKKQFGVASVRVKKEEQPDEDDKSEIKRVREVYRCLSPVVTKRKRGKKDEDKTYTVTENGNEVEGGEDDHLDSNNSENDMEDSEEIMIDFVGNDEKWGRNRIQRIRVMEYASLSMAFKEFTSRIDRTLSYHTLRFLWDGQRLDGEKAAADYGLADGNQIDVFQFQHGGI